MYLINLIITTVLIPYGYENRVNLITANEQPVIVVANSTSTDTLPIEEHAIFINTLHRPIFADCPLEELSRKCTNRKLLTYFFDNITYTFPSTAHRIESLAVISFTVCMDGTVSNVVIERGRYLKKQSNIIDVIYNMPIWNPGTENAQTVDSKVTFPLRIHWR